MPQVAPQLVIAASYNSTALNVSWNAIEQTRENVRGKLIGHRVKCTLLFVTCTISTVFYFNEICFFFLFYSQLLNCPFYYLF